MCILIVVNQSLELSGGFRSVQEVNEHLRAEASRDIYARDWAIPVRQSEEHRQSCSVTQIAQEVFAYCCICPNRLTPTRLDDEA